MRKVFFWIVIGFVSISMAISASPDTMGNLIINSNFENNSNFLLDPWYCNNCKGDTIAYATGGRWSVSLYGGDIANVLYQNIGHIRNGSLLLTECLSLIDSFTSFKMGYYYSTGNYKYCGLAYDGSSCVLLFDSTWRKYQFIDTIRCGTDDSCEISLMFQILSNKKSMITHVHIDMVTVIDISVNTVEKRQDEPNVPLIFSPNPFSRSFKIANISTKDFICNIFDVNGRMVSKRLIKGSSFKMIEFGQYPSGIYIVRANASGFDFTKIIINK